MTKKPYGVFGRYMLLLAGLLVMAFGVACSIKAGLGTSPISSVPYALYEITGLSVGVTTILLHVTLILIQILLLRRRYDPIQLLQLPVALVFGGLTDVAVWAIGGITCPNYGVQWLLCLLGILLVGVGVSFEVTANVITLAGEGVVLAICRVFPVPFLRAKVGFDVSLVLIACALSLVFLGKIVGVREGTVAAAILVGLTSKQVNKLLKRIALRKMQGTEA